MELQSRPNNDSFARPPKPADRTTRYAGRYGRFRASLMLQCNIFADGIEQTPM